MRHRKRRNPGRVITAALAVVAAFSVFALPFSWPDGHERDPTRARLSAVVHRAPVTQPTARASPVYLTRSYHAPAALIRPGAGGTLRIPSLGIEAPVDAVGLDGTAMAIPDDPGRIGWLTSSARAGDLVGSSVLAGHVSDSQDRPGALFRLRNIRLGAAITWTDGERSMHRFRVVRIRIYPRAGGLPAATFATNGPHVLHLITCAERISTAGGGFHYRSNLVVTAVR
jgi:hypothetical protein